MNVKRGTRTWCLFHKQLLQKSRYLKLNPLVVFPLCLKVGIPCPNRIRDFASNCSLKNLYALIANIPLIKKALKIRVFSSYI